MKAKFKEIIKKGKWLENVILTIALMLIVISAYIGINLLVKKIDIADIDLTKEKLNSLSQESKDKIKNISKDTKIIIYGMSSYQEVFDYAKLYSKENSHITYENLTDATSRADLQLEYGLGTVTKDLVIVETEDRKKAVMETDLYTTDYTTYESIDTTEQALTNAILDVNLDKTPKVYFATNHAKYANLYQTFSELLKNEANEVEKLDLLVEGNVPEDCDVLILTTLKEDFSEYERDLIINYINNGGNVLVLAEPNNNKVDLTNFQQILDLYGLSISNEILYETKSSRMINGYSNFILPNVSETSEITRYISSDGAVAFMNAGKIIYKSSSDLETLGVKTEDLVTTTNGTFLRADTTSEIPSKTDADQDAPESVIGTIATKKVTGDKSSKLILYSDAFFASDMTITLNSTTSNVSKKKPGIGFYNNKDLVINSISYLTQRNDNLVIRKDAGVVTYTATKQQDQIIRIIITVLPLAIIIAGIIVWQVRRRKK